MDANNPSADGLSLPDSGAQQRKTRAPSNEMIALDRANVPLLLGAVVALLVLLIGYWIEHRYVVLAGGFGVFVMALSWVLIAWLSLFKSFFNWLNSRPGRR
jgi:uncharacterized membrane protein